MTRKAIVTGGSSGIGRSTAVALAKSGYDLGITYASSREEGLETAGLVEAAGRRCFVTQLDLSNPDAAAPCIDAIVSELGGLDVMVSNAGMMVHRAFADIDLATTRQIFNVNTFGALMAIQRAVHHMVPAGTSGSPRVTPGRVIVVTSVHEEIANPVDTLYTMTKHALGGMVKCLALELSPLNITVNSVAPGEVATPMNGMKSDEYDDTDRPAIPVRRSGHPDEVAAVINFLASDQAGFVSGARWPVDGGFEAAAPFAATAYREACLAD